MPATQQLDLIIKAKTDVDSAMVQVTSLLKRSQEQLATQSKASAAHQKALAAAFDEARGKAQQLASQLGPTGSVLSAIGPAGVAAAAGLAVAAAGGIAAFAAMKQFVEIALKAAAAGGAIADSMQKTGATAAMVSGTVTLAAKTSGSSMEAIGGAVSKMQKAIVAGDAAFKQLGLDLASLKTMTPDAAFEATARAILAIENPTEQAAAAMAVFGKSGAEILPTLKSIAGGAAEMADAIGASLSDREVAALDALDDAASALALSWERLQQHFVAALNDTGLLSGGLDALAKALGDVSKFVAANAEAVSGLAAVFLTAAKNATTWAEALLRITGFTADFERLKQKLEEVAQAERLAGAVAAMAFAKNFVGPPVPPGYKPPPPPGFVDPAVLAAQAAALAKAAAEQKKAMEERIKFNRQAVEEEIALALKSAEAQKKAAWDLAKKREEFHKEEMQRIAQAGAAAADRLGQHLIDQQEEQRKAAQEAYEEQMERAQKYAELGQAVGQARDLLISFGLSAESAFAKFLAGIEAGLAAAAQFIQAQNAMQKAMAVMSAAQSAFNSGSVLGGAATGAAIGTAIAPGIGTAIGAVAGGLLGLFGKSKKAAAEAAAELKRVREAAMQAADKLVEMGQRLEDMRRAFVDKAVSSLPALFENFAKQADHSQAALDRLSRMGAAAFAALRAAGVSVVDAMMQMGPAIEAAIKAAQKSGHALTGPMAQLAAFYKKVQANKGVIDAIAALGDQLAMLRSSLLGVTQAAADDAMAQLADQAAQLAKAGFSTEEILALLAPILYQLSKAAEEGKIKLDAATQAMIDQAKAGGQFDGMVDPMDKLIELQEAMLALWMEIARVLGAEIPDAARKAAAAIGNVPPPPGGGGAGTGTDDGAGTGPGGGPGGGAGLPGYAEGGYVPYTPGGRPVRVAERAGEHILSSPQLSAAVTAGVKAAVGEMARMGGGGGLTQVTVPLMLNATKLGEVILQNTRDGVWKVHTSGLTGR